MLMIVAAATVALKLHGRQTSDTLVCTLLIYVRRVCAVLKLYSTTARASSGLSAVLMLMLDPVACLLACLIDIVLRFPVEAIRWERCICMMQKYTAFFHYCMYLMYPAFFIQELRPNPHASYCLSISEQPAGVHPT